MHLLSISAREECNHDNQHPRVCVLWAHDCAACRCSSGADARKSIRRWAFNHLQPATIDQTEHILIHINTRLPTYDDGLDKYLALINTAEALSQVKRALTERI